MNKKKVLIIVGFVISILIIGLSVYKIVKTSSKLKVDNKEKKENITEELDSKNSLNLYLCSIDGINEFVSTECDKEHRNEKYTIKTESKNIEFLDINLLRDGYAVYIDNNKLKIYDKNTQKIEVLNATEEDIKELKSYEEYVLVKDDSNDIRNGVVGILALSESTDFGREKTYNKSVYYDIKNNKLLFKDKYDFIIYRSDIFIAFKYYETESYDLYIIDSSTQNELIKDHINWPYASFKYDKENKILYRIDLAARGSSVTIYDLKEKKKLFDCVHNYVNIKNNNYFSQNQIIYSYNKNYEKINESKQFQDVIYILKNIEYAVVVDNNELLLYNIKTGETYKIVDYNDTIAVSIITKYYSEIDGLEIYELKNFKPGIYIGLCINETLKLFYFDISTEQLSEVEINNYRCDPTSLQCISSNIKSD